ncbi:MAG: protein kinase [Lachnospiraceae bacterium]|nr:protein kinase [Lachnospiraceae bacterium]
MRYEIGQTVLDNWKIVRVLGEGSFGKVFEIVKESGPVSVTSALKVITIPKSDSEVIAIRNEGLDEVATRKYFKSMVDEVSNEIVMMASVKNHPNVVRYEDHEIIEHTESLGWDVLTRMEMLTPMDNYVNAHSMSEDDILAMGEQICSALEYCHKKGMIHRDIKPANLFVNEIGYFKLGDFGIARTVEKTTGEMSQKGTLNYMAPEIYMNKPYGASVDIYSLGMVMYRMLNMGRAPFMPLPPAVPTREDRDNAMVRRMGGEVLPAPANASPIVADVLLKACSADVNYRYKSAAEFKKAIARARYEIENATVNDKTVAAVESGISAGAALATGTYAADTQTTTLDAQAQTATFAGNKQVATMDAQAQTATSAGNEQTTAFAANVQAAPVEANVQTDDMIEQAQPIQFSQQSQYSQENQNSQPAKKSQSVKKAQSAKKTQPSRLQPAKQQKSTDAASKKSKKPVIITSIVLAAVAACVAIVLIIVNSVGSSVGDRVADVDEEDEVVMINLYRATFNIATSDYNQVQKVSEEINKKLEAKGARVRINIVDVSSNSYEDVLLPAIKSGEADLFWTASWFYNTSPNELYKNELVYDITNIIEGSEFEGTMQSGIWQDAKYDGRLYFVPVYRDLCEGYDIMVPEYLVNKYGWNVSNISSLYDIEPMLKDLKRDGYTYPYTSIGGVKFASVYNDEYDFFMDDGLLAIDRSTNTVINPLQTNDYYSFAMLMSSWVEKGYMSIDDYKQKTNNGILSSDDWGFTVATCLPGEEFYYEEIYGMTMIMLEGLTDNYFNANSVLGSCYAVNASCTRAEAKAAVDFLYYVNTDTEIADLYTYGIEGEDYEVVLGRVNSYSTAYSHSAWESASVDSVTISVNGIVSSSYYKYNNSMATTSCAAGFHFDPTPVRDEYQACLRLWQQEAIYLENGAYSTNEVAGSINSLQEMLDSVGYQDILAEAQRQYEAWLEKL